MKWVRVFEAARRAFPGCVIGDNTSGRLVRFAPDPRKPGKKSAYAVAFDDGGGVIGDFRTDYQEYVPPEHTHTSPMERRKRLVEAQVRAEREEQERQMLWTRHAEANERLWESGREIGLHTPAGRYLRSRDVFRRGLEHALRWLPNLPYYENREYVGDYHAMLGAVRDVEGNLVGVHRTYLTGLGNKAPVNEAKKMTPLSARLPGCSIQIGSPIEREGLLVIGVAEGIETALSCWVLFGVPTVSAMNAHCLAQYKWPTQVQRIYAYGDNDDSRVGQKAAETLATRAQRAGLSAKVMFPNKTGDDWADVLEQRLAEA